MVEYTCNHLRNEKLEISRLKTLIAIDVAQLTVRLTSLVNLKLSFSHYPLFPLRALVMNNANAELRVCDLVLQVTMLITASACATLDARTMCRKQIPIR